MRIACPYCACAETTDAPKNRDKALHCKNGHAFNFEDGLVRLSDVVPLARALDHPNRVRILIEFGRHGEMSATEVGERTGMDVGTARYHIVKLMEHKPPLLVAGRTVMVNGATEKKYELGRGLVEGSGQSSS